MMEKIILDACALIAYLNDEPGVDAVEAALLKASENEAAIIMNKLNLLEVYYDVYRRCGEAAASSMLEKVTMAPIIIEPKISDAVFKEAGRLKASYKISIADSIALAETSVSGGTLLTSDHHELDAVESAEMIKFRWIR